MPAVTALAAAGPVPVASYARIVDAEKNQVEIVLYDPADSVSVRSSCVTCTLSFVGFSFDECRAVAALLQEHSETKALVRCIQDRLASGVFDGEEERRARTESALGKNLRRLEELKELLDAAKRRIVDGWRRRRMESTPTHREKMLRPVTLCS